MKKFCYILTVTLAFQLSCLNVTVLAQQGNEKMIQNQAAGFLALYNQKFQELYKESAEAEWKLNTYITSTRYHLLRSLRKNIGSIRSIP